MTLQTRALDNVGVEVLDFDIREPMTEELQQEIKDLWLEHGIVLFRDQQIGPAEQIEFSRLFGPLQKHPLKETRSQEYPELFVLENGGDKDKFATASYNGKLFVNRLDWHMDLHYTGKPNHGALIRAKIVPEEDGRTGFGDLAKAYDALDKDTRQRIQDIEVAYCFSMQRRHMRFVQLEGYEPGPHSPRSPADMKFPNFPDAIYPAVVTHPDTGRKVLEITEQMLDRVVDPHKAELSNDEAVDLLQFLVDHTRKPEFHYFHAWREGDMVLWDNWRAMHCATGTRPGVKRLMHRTTIAGDVTLGRLAA